jgi:hypothetical protein
MINPDKTLARGKGAEATTGFDLSPLPVPSRRWRRAVRSWLPTEEDHTKRYSYKEVDGRGYEFRHKLPVPAEADRGSIDDSVLYVNGKEASKASNNFRARARAAGSISHGLGRG